jgi:hypothetical protein
MLDWQSCLLVVLQRTGPGSEANLDSSLYAVLNFLGNLEVFTHC